MTTSEALVWLANEIEHTLTNHPAPGHNEAAVQALSDSAARLAEFDADAARSGNEILDDATVFYSAAGHDSSPDRTHTLYMRMRFDNLIRIRSRAYVYLLKGS